MILRTISFEMFALFCLVVNLVLLWKLRRRNREARTLNRELSALIDRLSREYGAREVRESLVRLRREWQEGKQ